MASGSLPSTQPAPQAEPAPLPSPLDAQVHRGVICALALTPTFLLQEWAEREDSSPKSHGWPIGLSVQGEKLVKILLLPGVLNYISPQD